MSDPGYDAEYDDGALAFFADVYREMSPERYAAGAAHSWGCFSFHLYRYRDPVLGAWVRRLGQILFDETAACLERYRQTYLTAEEHARVRQEIADIEEHGF
jgi:hypothetical protein